MPAEQRSCHGDNLVSWHIKPCKIRLLQLRQTPALSLKVTTTNLPAGVVSSLTE
jgi:hypothetical protein